MIKLVSELTDKELLQRITNLENYRITVVEKLSLTQDLYQSHILHKKRKIALLHYAHAIHEAAYRKLLTIH